MSTALMLSISMLVFPVETKAAVRSQTFTYTSGGYYYYAKNELTNRMLCSKLVSNSVELDKENYNKNDSRVYTTVSIGKNVSNTITGTASIKIPITSVVKSIEATFGISYSHSDTTTEAYTFYVYRNDKKGFYYVKETLYGYSYECTQAHKVNTRTGETEKLSSWLQTISYLPGKSEPSYKRGYSKVAPSKYVYDVK